MWRAACEQREGRLERSLTATMDSSPVVPENGAAKNDLVGPAGYFQVTEALRLLPLLAVMATRVDQEVVPSPQVPESSPTSARC